MFRKLLPAAVVLLLLLQTTTSVAQSSAKKLTPIELNNTYSAVSDSLFARGTEWGGILNKAMTSGEYIKLKPVRVSMQQFIEAKQKEIKASPLLSGSGPFKEAMLHFLDFEMSMTTSSFMPFEKLTADSKPEEVNGLIEKVTTNSKGEEAVLAEVQKTQSEYAKKNGFSIEGAGTK